MTGKLLSIDPGCKTGWALIDLASERVVEFGVLRQVAPDFPETIRALAERAQWVAVEDQYVGNDPHAALCVAESKGRILGMVAGHIPPDRVRVILAQTWQARLKLKGKRKQRKRGAFILAQAALDLQTQGGPLTQDSADAICMGLAAVRMLKAEELLDRRVSNA
ncbi:hypothetical protein LLH00_05845 [bacterium]|nr:hypothetical protein [bacterium]